ncbi:MULTISPECIES: cell division protein FtsQ/DivIB [unclassified Roseitalea]|uniref:cell division protein FtsQ/DivIB n=1 Tax=unclassified Roseitalea TaxID=2639107 RepID=UPI00273E6562|nr:MULTISPECIES: cell division protein FtsQ/DivIB [unclassified Roseitalea]
MPSGAGERRGLILPRVLRRPMRFLQRLAGGHVAVPRRAEAMVFGAAIGGAVLYGSMVGGQLFSAVDAATATAGFAVGEIEISGNTYTTPQQVYATLGLDAQRSLIMIDPADAQDRLAKLPWIDKARIAKVYPSRLVIEVTEREPFAVWQTGDALAVIERDGAVIGGYAADPRLAALPLLVGKGAEDKGAAFIARVAPFRPLAERVRAYIHVGQRRWDLRLDNGITVRLPENGVELALGRITAMQGRLGVFERDLAAIDLRLADRTVFALTENALARHEAAVEAREQALKQRSRERSI